MTHQDRKAQLARSRIPRRVTATEQVVELGTEVIVTAINVQGGAGASGVELRSGGAGGDPDFALRTGGGADGAFSVPGGIHFPDGLHATLTAGDEVVYLVTN